MPTDVAELMASPNAYRYLGLAYVGLNVEEIEHWTRFATDFLGAELNSELSSGSELKLKFDSRSWRLSVRASDHNGVGFLGFEVRSADELLHLAEQLENGGYSVTRCSSSQAEERNVVGLLRTNDPSGVPVEIFYGAAEDFQFTSGADVSSFVTGEMGLGHAVLCVHDLDAMVSFYVETLGFHVSDYSSVGSNRSAFLRCSPREHNLALVEVRPTSRAPRLLHIMVEAGSIADVGRAHDRAAEMGIPLTVSLGQHTNDQMFSFYCKSPGGFDFEVGALGRQLPPGAPVSIMRARDVWGHHLIARVKADANAATSVADGASQDD
jgi:2,3-dihydroxybiphenyl 1,2-dioxygenase